MSQNWCLFDHLFGKKHRIPPPEVMVTVTKSLLISRCSSRPKIWRGTIRLFLLSCSAFPASLSRQVFQDGGEVEGADTHAHGVLSLTDVATDTPRNPKPTRSSTIIQEQVTETGTTKHFIGTTLSTISGAFKAMVPVGSRFEYP